MKANGKYMRLFIGGICSCMLMLFLTLSCFAAENSRVLRVAFYPLDGFFEYDSNGQEKGYGVELLDKLSESTGIKFEYVVADSWEQTKEMLLSGEADIRMPGTRSVNLSTDLAYTDESIMDTYHAVMTLKSNEDIFYKDYEKFPTLKIAMVKSLYNNTDVKEYLDEINITEDNLLLLEEYSQCRQALDTGEADALISNIMDLTDDMKVLVRFYAISNYISMRKDDPDISKINMAIRELKMDDPTFLPMLYQKYYPERTATPYTREEAEYVKNAGTIIVGQLAGTVPLSDIDEETGEISGMFVDLCELLSKKSGLTFQYKLLPEGTRAVDWLMEGNGQLVAGVMYSPFSKPSTALMHSDVAFATSVVLVGREGDGIDIDSDITIAIPKGFIGGETYIKENYPNATISFYETNEECLEAIAKGEADFLLQNIYVSRDALQSPRFDSLDILPVYEVEEDMRLVMLENEDQQLMSVINKALASITDEELNNIIVAHTMAKPYTITLADTYYKFKTPILIIEILFFLVLGLSILVIWLRHRNMKRIQAKNIQLEEAYEQARIASSSKSNFLARMSHEIRTPMNAIIGITTLAMDHIREPETVKEDLNKVALSSRVLLSIINDVLDMSAIESGKLKIDSAPFDFNQLLSSIATVYAEQCQTKGIEFKLEDSEIISEWLVGDQLRLNQILMNLLSNAVKFTEEGSVTLTVKQQAVQDKIRLLLTVTDTGSGMDEEMLQRLGEPFEQENAGTARKYGGSGLGLSIVKSLIVMMNGTWSVSSKKAQGSSFSVELPFERYLQQVELERTSQEAEQKKSPVATNGINEKIQKYAHELAGRRILLTEDNDMNRIVATGLLKKVGIICETAVNGQLALEMFTASQPHYYDVILMDIQMPVMDGYEATRSIRACAHPQAKTIPIIAMTANAFKEDVAACLQSGMNDHVAKPIELSVLLDTVYKWLYRED